MPAVEWVTVTHYTTVLVGHNWYEASSSQTSATEAAETVSTVAASVVDAEWEETSTSAVATAAAAVETSPAPAASPASSSASSSAASPTGSVFSGQGTYYSTGLGACGITNVDTDYIVAISHELYDQYTPDGNPNKNTLCGKKIQASYEGKSVEVTVVDRCEGCQYYDLDFSPSAFQSIADESLGRIDITWQWA